MPNLTAQLGNAGWGVPDPDYPGEWLSDAQNTRTDALMLALAHYDRRREYHVSEIYGDGERFPVPGPAIWTGRAEDACDALNRYSVAQGFSPYGDPEDTPEPPEGVDADGRIIPTVWNADGTIASAPFTNTELVAYTDEAIS